MSELTRAARRAGGVYYTPAPLIEFLVPQVLDRLLREKTPRGAAQLRIVDPACGAGFFLVAAYQYLLDWHRERYLADGAAQHVTRLEARPGPAGD